MGQVVFSNQWIKIQNVFECSPNKTLQTETPEDKDDRFQWVTADANLFQSLQHSASESPPSIKSATSISSNSSVLSTNSNHSETSQQNPFMAITLASGPKRDEAKISALTRPKKSLDSSQGYPPRMGPRNYILLDSQ